MGGDLTGLAEDAEVVSEAPSDGILSAGEPVSYWFDACEDGIARDFDFAEFGSSIAPDQVANVSDKTSDDGNFFNEFDQILESFNDALLHRPAVEAFAPPQKPVKGDGILGPPPNQCSQNSRRMQFPHRCTQTNGKSDVVSDRKMNFNISERSKRGFIEDSRRKEDNIRDVKSFSKRRHQDGDENEFNDSWRETDRGRKRVREEWEWRESKYPRDWDQRFIRDRETRNSRERSVKEREGKGFWERDQSGKMIYSSGSWESKKEKSKHEVLDREKKDINLQDERERPIKEQARKYQLDVLEQAKKKNTIAFLETGAGKTLIAVLLMKSISAELERKRAKMLAIFLVPKVPLVYQQAEVIRNGTGFNVGHYCGEMGQDFWDARRWQREFETKQVLVMTAQILLNILRHSIIKMESIHILILDECHHAVKKHPYSLVMSEFYHTTPKHKRPAVFGMTASPVNLKGVSNQEDCAIKIRNLESKLDSTVCTIKDRKELERHVPTPLEVLVHYDKAGSLCFLHEQIKQLEAEVDEAAHSSCRRSKWQFMGARDAGSKEELRFVYGVSERTESDGAANLLQKLRAINYALAELGQWCAFKVALSFLMALQVDEKPTYNLDVKFQESYLKKVVKLLDCPLSEGAALEKGLKGENQMGIDAQSIEDVEEGELPESHILSGGEHVDLIMGAAVADGRVTPKVQSLIKILLNYQHTQDFRAIIFVERVVAALVLPKLFSELPSLNFIKCASLIGHNNNQEMSTCQVQDTISKFRDGRVTVLVATSVAEEGLDIRQCNVVIRFDLAKTVLAYIQSRGRARKPGSDYILMLERENVSHETFLRNARNSEETLRKEAIERTDLTHFKGSSKLKSVDILPGSIYKVESTGAIVSLNSAVGLVHLYCSQLPSDRYSILRPEFIMERHESPCGSTEYSCKLLLPCNAPFEKLEGPVCSSIRLAQQAVCLAACKKLHEMGAFTDMLLPDKGSGHDDEKNEESNGDPLPGTAHHREFYPEGVAEILHGEWVLPRQPGSSNSEHLRLYMYAVECINIGTSKDQFLTQCSDFAVLFGNKLSEEVLSMNMELFIAKKMSTEASLLFKGVLDIDEDQLNAMKSFHVRLMSIVLDIDVDPCTTPWDPLKAYLFVPTRSHDHADPMKEVDWYTIHHTVASAAWSNPIQRARPDVYLGTNERTLGGDRREYGFGKLRQNGLHLEAKIHPTYGIRGAIAPFDVVKASGFVPCRSSRDLIPGKLAMADSYISPEELVGKIVTTAHSGKRFYVDSVRYDMTAENSFPKKEGYLGPLEYDSYSDYYRKKYGVDLKHKNQPLLRGRGVSYCKNLLSPRFGHLEEKDSELKEDLDKTYYVFLPPELCLVHPLPGPLVRGAQRLPSIMRRVESVLLAAQLKNAISYPIPIEKILESLTAASCQETFCYERAELLGDAYLKWVVSRYLFLKYPQKHEGQLTRMRQQMVSNMVLYQCALNKGLQSYIQADRFAPSRWTAPGVPPVFDEEIISHDNHPFDSDDEREDGEIDGDSGCYRVLSSKTLADVVEALIGVYYVEGGELAANHFMKWVGIRVDFDLEIVGSMNKACNVSESIMKSIDFDGLESTLNTRFKNKSLLVEAITHASRPSGVPCYQRLEFVGDAVLDHLITSHLFFTYTDLPPGRLTDLRAAAVNNENFARVAVKHNLQVHLRHGSTALETQIREFVKNVQDELTKPGFNSFGLGDCKAPKVLGDIVESIAGAIFLDNGCQLDPVWKVFQPLLHPMVTPETLPMHPVRELQERCQQQAEGLEYKATRSGNVATVQVFVNGVAMATAQNPQKKMAQKLAARNALTALKEKETKTCPEVVVKEALVQAYTRQTLNDMCLRRQWPMPQYRCVNEGGPAHAKRFVYAVRVNTSDFGWTDECIGGPMPSVKKAKDSAAALLLELLDKRSQRASGF